MKNFLTWICAGSALVGLFWALRWAGSLTPSVAEPVWPRVDRIEGSAAVELRYEGGETLHFDTPPQRVLPGNAAWVDYLSVLLKPERVCALPATSEEYSRLRTANDELTGWHDLPRFSGYGAETVLPFEPDLVLVHAWQKPDVTALLRGEGIAIVVLPMPDHWDDIEKTLRVLGTLLSVEKRATTVIEANRKRIVSLRRRLSARGKLRALSYTNLGSGGSVAGAATSADILFHLAGLENVAAKAGLVGYRTLDLEGLLRMDPDVIVVDDAHSDAITPPTRAFLYAEEGLKEMEAIRERRVIALSTELFTTCSQELLTGAERLVDELNRLEAGR